MTPDTSATEPTSTTSNLDGAGTTTMVLRQTFYRLSRDDVNQLRQVATMRSYPIETVLCHEGEVEHTFYVLHTGIVRVVQRVSADEERLLALRGPGEFFGEMALVDDSPRSASVIAATPVQVIEITEDVFEQVLAHSPSLALTLLRHSNLLLRTTMQQQIAELEEKNAQLRRAFDELQAAETELVRTERMQRDLEVAAQVQRSILPTEFPSVSGIQFAAHAQPAREMGGDFYDAFKIDDEHVGLLVADVSDKSIHAAFFMAISRALFLTEARRSLSPHTVICAVNDLLLDVSSEDNMFVTVFYGVLCLDDRTLTYVRAGHDKPLLQHADGTLDILDGAGRFLGMLPGLVVEERTAWLRSGDRLVMFSDGVPDATNPAGERFGAERLRAIVHTHRSADAATLTGAISDGLLAFQGNAQQFDDITLLVAAIE